MNATIRMIRPDEFFKIHRLNTRWMAVPLDSQADAILSLQFRVLLDHFNDSCFIAEAGGRAVGLIIGFAAQCNGEDCYIHALAVAPAFRRRNLGRTLVDTFCDLMARRGRGVVSLVTWPDNPPSRAFYEKIGFTPRVVGEPIEVNGITASRDYYGPNRHMVLYAKRLTAAGDHRKAQP